MKWRRILLTKLILRTAPSNSWSGERNHPSLNRKPSWLLNQVLTPWLIYAFRTTLLFKLEHKGAYKTSTICYRLHNEHWFKCYPKPYEYKEDIIGIENCSYNTFVSELTHKSWLVFYHVSSSSSPLWFTGTGIYLIQPAAVFYPNILFDYVCLVFSCIVYAYYELQLLIFNAMTNFSPSWESHVKILERAASCIPLVAAQLQACQLSDKLHKQTHSSYCVNQTVNIYTHTSS